MTTAESPLEINAWEPEDQIKHLEHEAEMNNSRSDTENNQHRYDSVENEPVPDSEKGSYILRTDESEAEGDGLESELDYDKNQEDGVIGSGDGQTDSDYRYDSVENEPVSESEKGNYILRTDESEAEGDGLESELDYDKNLDDGVIGSGNGQTDTDATPCSAAPRCEVDMRHRSGHGSTCGNASLGLIRKESAKHDRQQQTGHPYKHDDGADSQKEVIPCNNTERRRTTSSARRAAAHTSFWQWLVFLAPRVACLVMLSMIYLGLAILSIRMLRLLTEQY
ncbi:hypothetical protein BsWGS_01152 [Bradybaena similaris]